MYLVDTNVWLEVLLAQERAAEAQTFFTSIDASQLAITEFSLYSLGIILNRLRKNNVFADFLSDTIDEAQIACIRLDSSGLKQALALCQQYQIDFDDAYQYVAAEKHDLIIVSFDKDFDRTTRGRKTPAEIIGPAA